MIMAYPIYSVNMVVLNKETGRILRKDTEVYHSLDTAKAAAKFFTQRDDIANVQVMDESTGEIVWHQ